MRCFFALHVSVGAMLLFTGTTIVPVLAVDVTAITIVTAVSIMLQSQSTLLHSLSWLLLSSLSGYPEQVGKMRELGPKPDYKLATL